MRKRIMVTALSAVLTVNTIGMSFAQEIALDAEGIIEEDFREVSGSQVEVFGSQEEAAGTSNSSEETALFSENISFEEESSKESCLISGELSDEIDVESGELSDEIRPAPGELFDEDDPVLSDLPDETDLAPDGLFDESGDPFSSEPGRSVLQEETEEEIEKNESGGTVGGSGEDLAGEDSEGMIVMDEISGLEAETEEETETETEAQALFLLSACEEPAEENDFFKDTEVIYDADTMEPFAGRTLEEVGERYADTYRVATTYRDTDEETWYEEMCSLKSPYSAGKLAVNTHEVMTTMQNYCRWLSGARPVTGESYHDENLQDQALDRNFSFGHIISVSAKPKDMPWEMWEKGILCRHNVLASGSTPKHCIIRWTNEGYDASADEWELGHRYFMIGQNVSGMCFGYSGNVGIGNAYSADDNSVPSDQAFTAYPAPGYMPQHMIDAKKSAWSVELNKNCVKYDKLADVTVRVTNLDTGESYLCTQENKKLTYTDSMLGFIQPASSSKSYRGARYQVDISGLKDKKTGKAAGITYQVHFVDIQETAPTRLSKISCACSAWYVPKALYNEEGLRMITTVLPRERVATASAENGATAGLPLAGGWTPDLGHNWFLGQADLTKLPANWEGDPNVENELRMAFVQTGSVSNPLHFERDGQILSEDEPAVEGDEIRFVLNCGYKKYRRIVRITRAEDGSCQAETVFDSLAGDAFYEEGDNCVFTRKVSLDDEGDYVGLISTSAWGTFYFPESFAHLHVRKAPAEIGDQRISGVFSRPYSGSPCTVTVNIYDGDKKLELDKDYTVQYENNINVGTGRIVITGIGDYKGTAYRDLRIIQAQIGKAQKESIPDQIYDGIRKRPKCVLVFNGQELHEEIDYKTEYRNNLNPGSASIVVTGIGNFKGSRTVYFNIVKPEPSEGDENDPTDQPTTSGGNNPADQQAPSGGNEPADQPAPTGGNEPTGQTTPSGGNEPTGQTTPSGGNEPTGQTTPSGGTEPTGQTTPAGGNNTTGQPAPSAVNQVTKIEDSTPAGEKSSVGNPKSGSNLQPETAAGQVKDRNTPHTIIKPVLPKTNTELITISRKPVIKKAKTGRKGKVTITWKKFRKTKKTKAIWKKIKGIEVQYSTDLSFRMNSKTLILGKKKTKLVLKGLKKKKNIYIRMRYTDGSGGYSGWSSVRKVKVKR